MNQISTNYYKLKYLKYKLKYKLSKQNMLSKNKLYSFNGVWAYSNGLEKNNNECKSDELNYNNGYFTGIKWQCVEYARRYVQTVFGVTFSQVDSAYEIPNAIFTRLEDNKIIEPSINNINYFFKKKSLDSLTNSLKKSLDLLSSTLIIWPKDYELDDSLNILKDAKHSYPHGHVAIIVLANKDGLYVAEQNYDNNDYYRFIPWTSLLDRNITVISII
jgi:hypothetical protein